MKSSQINQLSSHSQVATHFLFCLLFCLCLTVQQIETIGGRAGSDLFCIFLFEQTKGDIQGVFHQFRKHFLLGFCLSEHRGIGVDLQQVGFQALTDDNITAQQLVSALFADQLPFCCCEDSQQYLFDLLPDYVGGLVPDCVPEELPGGDGVLLPLLVELMLVLEAVVGEVDHQFGLVLDVLLRVVLDGEPQVPLVEEHQRRLAVEHHEASDVELLPVQQQRPDVVLDQSVMLQFHVLVLALGAGLGG